LSLTQSCAARQRTNEQRVRAQGHDKEKDMRIKATDFNGKDVRVSIEAENEAEAYQLQAIKGQLDKAGTNWQEWNDMEGRGGVVIVAEKRSNAELKGGQL